MEEIAQQRAPHEIVESPHSLQHQSDPFPTSSGIGGGGSGPCDIGPQTEIGRTSKGGSTALLEGSPAPTIDESEEETPTFKVLPWAGEQPSGEAGVFRFTLLFFFASTSKRARSSPRVGFVIRGSKAEDEEGLEKRGKEGFMAEGGEDQD